MQAHRLVTLVLTALLASTACATSTAVATNQPAAAAQQHQSARLDLEQRQQAFFAALSARDADAVSALFAESALLHVANMPPVSGRVAIEQFHRRLFGFLAESQAEAEHLDVADNSDMAFSVGSTSNAFRGGDGQVRYAGKYSIVWRQVEGQWLIVLYSVSSNQADPAR
jgi:ketosteroid isomerase-like protein